MDNNIKPKNQQLQRTFPFEHLTAELVMQNGEIKLSWNTIEQLI